jgi:hypothetical protein
LRVEGARLYSTAGRETYLDRLSHPEIACQLRGYYEVLDVTLGAQKQVKAQMIRLGQAYPELREFQKVPGVGAIGSRLFDAFTGDVLSPRRHTASRRSRSSGATASSASAVRLRRDVCTRGKPLGYEQLDPTGRSELKAMSYQAWLAVLRHSGNEVATFFEESLARTGDRTHARLNTQRKILLPLWALWERTLWKRQSTYCSDRYLEST